MIEFSRAATSGFARPEVWNIDLPFENAPAPHATLMQNFVDAIVDGVPLQVPGAEGIHSVELANVMLYSSLMKETVALPMDSGAFERALQKLIADSTVEKKVRAISADDFTKSFRR